MSGFIKKSEMIGLNRTENITFSLFISDIWFVGLK